MFGRNFFSYSVILFFAPIILYAQEVPSASSPALATEEMPIMSPENRINNIVLAKFSAAIYDDNVGGTGNNQISSPIYMLTSSIALEQKRPHWDWYFSYSPGVRLMPGVVQGSMLDQSLGTGFTYQPTSRVSVHFRQDFLLSTDPFQQLGNNSLESSLNPLQRPNDIVALPQVKRNELFSGADLSYRSSPHTTVGLGGSFIGLDYSQLADSIARSPLFNTQQLSGSGFLSHDLTSRQTAGIEYTHLAISADQEHTDTDRVVYFHKISLTSSSRIVFFAGPEYSRSRDDSSSGVGSSSARIPIRLNSISPDAGVMYTFSGRSIAIQASYLRNINASGRLATASRTDAMDAWVQKKIIGSWTGDLEAYLGNSESVLPSNRTKVRTVFLSFGFGYTLPRNLRMRLSYQRIHQTDDVPRLAPTDTNRMSMSIERSFSWPLGR